jgi:hypothetical protein
MAAALTVMVSVALAVPELVSSAVPDTPVLPHVLPDSVNAMLVALPVKLGSTSVIRSFTAMLNGAVKVYDKIVAEFPVVVLKIRASELIGFGAEYDAKPLDKMWLDEPCGTHVHSLASRDSVGHVKMRHAPAAGASHAPHSDP